MWDVGVFFSERDTAISKVAPWFIQHNLRPTLSQTGQPPTIAIINQPGHQD